MPDLTGVTLQQLSDAENKLNSQVEPASTLKTKVDGEGLDMMAWGLPGLAVSPGYYQALGELRELFGMMVDGLEGHSERLKACREGWENADALIAREFSSYDPAGLADSIDYGGATFTKGSGNYATVGPVAAIDKNAWKVAPGGAVVAGAMLVDDKILAVTRAENAGEMMAALADTANTLVGLGAGVIGLVTNPLGTLINGGLSFLLSFIQPVDDLIGMVTGNNERMMAEIVRWESIKTELPKIGDAVAEIPEGMLSQWAGKDGDAAREKIAEFGEAIFELADKIQVLQGLMQLCELIASTIRQSLIDLLSNWIEGQILMWATTSIASAFTFGGAAAAQLVNSIRSACQTVIIALNRYRNAADAFLRAHQVLKTIQTVFDVAAKPLSGAGFKSVKMIGTLAGANGPSTTSIAEGFAG